MKRALVAVTVAATAFAAWRWQSSTPVATDGGDAKLTLDRLWIDHIPKDDKDPVKIFVALTQQPVGIFQTTTTWKGEYEVFQFQRKGGEIRAVFPQTGEREKFSVSGTECHEHGMDYCLEMRGASRGAKHYYSMKGWEVDGADVKAIPARVDALLHVTR